MKNLIHANRSGSLLRQYLQDGSINMFSVQHLQAPNVSDGSDKTSVLIAYYVHVLM
jgi:hypothetical protein